MSSKLYCRTESDALRGRTANSRKGNLQPEQDQAMQLSGVICLEMELMLVEINREITNMRKQLD